MAHLEMSTAIELLKLPAGERRELISVKGLGLGLELVVHTNRECDGTSLEVDASKIGDEHRVSEIEPLGMIHVRCREFRETHHRSMLGPTILPSHTHMCRYCFLHGQSFRLETPWTFD